jgi:predicted patatin/cPLA2 family phospholipase
MLEILQKHQPGVSDGMVTGLVVQGGGMRGVYSMGALAGLEELGLGLSFDHVLGASAGAINGAYMLGEQARLAVTVYTDDISNKQFIDFFRCKKAIDIDFLVDEVLTKVKPLDVNGVLKSPSVLHIALTHAESGKTHYVTDKQVGSELMQALKATAALPGFYNQLVVVEGRTYIDGAVLDAIPLFRALALGCTHIVVVITRPLGFRRAPSGFLINGLKRWLLRSLPPGARRATDHSGDLLNGTMAILEHPCFLGDRVKIVTVAPRPLTQRVTRATCDRDKLVHDALLGRSDAYAALGVSVPKENPFA